MNDYKVASFPAGPGKGVAQQPEGTCHAYRRGGESTACGFGLGQMHRFELLRFDDQPPAVRCPLCARIVGAADR